MQCLFMGYRGNATCHLDFHLYTHTRLKAPVYTEKTSDAWHIPRYPTRNHYITTMYYREYIIVLCNTVPYRGVTVQ